MSDHRGALRDSLGKVVRVACADGHDVEGTLLDVNRRSLWLVTGDDDVVIPWQDVRTVS